MIWFGCHSYFLILIHSYCLVQYTFIYLLIIPTQTTDWGHLLMWSFLADRTATQYDRLLGAACCPSVCLWRCAFWLSGSVYRAKSYTSMFLAGMFLFVPSDTFCRMYRLATKHILEKTVGNVVSVVMDWGWHTYRKGTTCLSTMTHSAHLDLCREHGVINWRSRRQDDVVLTPV